MLKIGCVVLLVIFVLVAVVGLLYVGRHKDEWLAAGKKADEEGRAYAAGKTVNDCVDESLRHLRACSGIGCEVRVQVFLSGCLKVAAPSPELCAAIPPRGEIMETAKWSLAECARRGLPNSQPCSRLFQEVQRHCAEAPATPTPAQPAESTVDQPRKEPAVAPPPTPATRTPSAEGEYKPKISITVEKVWADNNSRLYYTAKCTERPATAYPIAKNLAVQQGYKPAPCN